MERNRTYKEVLHGQRVIFNEMQPSDYFDTYEALRIGKFTGQHRFDMPEVELTGGLEISIVTPVEAPPTLEEVHLLRPTAEQLRWNRRIL